MKFLQDRISLVAGVLGVCLLQSLVAIVTYEAVTREMMASSGTATPNGNIVPHVFNSAQTHCKGDKTIRMNAGSDAWIVDVNLEHALSTASRCFALNTNVAILIVVERLPTRFYKRSTQISSRMLHVTLDDETPKHVRGIWYTQVGGQAPKDLLAFEDHTAWRLSDREMAAMFGKTSGPPQAVWIRSPCESVHNDVERTTDFSVKLHEFVHAWDLMLLRNAEEDIMVQIVVEECEQPLHTTTLLHNSVMFRPSELQSRSGNTFEFSIARRSLRDRRDAFFRQGGMLGLDTLQFANSRQNDCRTTKCRYAYMTVLHSDGNYVCGAIVMGHSVRRFDPEAELVALVTKKTPQKMLDDLRVHGWKVVEIETIKGPEGTPPWFVFNFSKLQAWKVADELGYDKVALIDSDILFEKDPSVLFNSQTSFAAVPQSTTVFNGGLLVFEPSTWLYEYMVEMIEMLGVPYAFAEQSFLNQIYGWRFHLFDKTDMKWKKNSPGPHTDKDFMIHYFGIKPWQCPSREADCNTMEHMRIRNNDDLFHHWFSVHDEMKESCANVPDHLPGFLARMVSPFTAVFA